jgi:hypothetical protein
VTQLLQLAIKRNVIHKPADEHVGKQTRTGTAFLNRARRQSGNYNTLPLGLAYLKRR